jgi:2-polyprenyl-3-methyl-5-hydroxy-6-metoxy-1,4-benzoquinol methylase
MTLEQSEMVCLFGHRWPIAANIPRMTPAQQNYTDAFGLQWNTYRRTQLDSYTKTTLSLERARRCLGDDCWRRLHSVSPTDVLEIGCGAGRFTEILLEAGARVTSVDMSSAVNANQENFTQTAYHRVVQADVCALPFGPQQFDIVFCLGVIQHTPDPEATINKLYAQVKPGGSLIIDHYTYNVSEFTKSAFLIRFIFCRMSSERALRWSSRLVDLFLPLHRAVRHHRIAQSLLSRLSPILTYYQTLPFDDDLQREWALLDTFDSLTDRYKHFRTKGQIRRCLQSLGAEAIWCEHGGNGVEARCRRPFVQDIRSRVVGDDHNPSRVSQNDS